jgi:cytochrome c-type biogenesis protein CcmH/NrfF
VIARFLVVVSAALLLAAPAGACAQPKTSLSFLEGQVMCPTCHTTLDMSDSAAAQQIEGFITRKIAKCWTAQQIETALVNTYGQAILAEPSHKGFDLLAWWLPIAAVLGGAIVLAFGVWRWSRGRDDELLPDAASGLDDETERKVDEALAGFD